MNMDEFAQSRDDNDLFDDEITPLEPGQTSGQISDPTETVPLERLTIEPDRDQPPRDEHVHGPPPAPRGRGRGRGGPPRKPKLSEAELSAKLASAKLKAESRAAAHARAEADKEAHEARERVAAEKRREEAKRRREMEGERERWRERKLEAKAGREWDEQKDDTHHRGPGPARDRLDGYRWKEGPEAADLSQYEWHDGRDDGGRNRHAAPQQWQPQLDKEEDFPSLPGAGAGASNNANKASKSQGEVSSPKAGEASTDWAEEVELAGAW
ncbi:hypothetical protein DV738_g1732, partial [Chaetothyriales sp. CBS 135597]